MTADERRAVILERVAERLEADSQRLEASACELLAHLRRATSLRPCSCGKFHVPAATDAIVVDGERHARGEPCRGLR